MRLNIIVSHHSSTRGRKPLTRVLQKLSIYLWLQDENNPIGRLYQYLERKGWWSEEEVTICSK